jgi:hypothetical protein
MKHCPTCGAVMRPETTTCGECGFPDDADPDDADTGDRPDRSVAREHRESHPLASGGSTDRSAEDAGQQQDDGESEEEPLESPAAGVDGVAGLSGEDASGTGGRSVPLDRRTLLFGSAGAIALAGGWAFFLRGDNEAKAVVERFYDALDRADLETIRSLAHDDGPLGGDFSGPSETFLQERTFTLELLSEYDRESADDNETVREFVYFGAVVSISRTDAPEEEEDEIEAMAQQITVAQNLEGEYLLWDVA